MKHKIDTCNYCQGELKKDCPNLKEIQKKIIKVIMAYFKNKVKIKNKKGV